MIAAWKVPPENPKREYIDREEAIADLELYEKQVIKNEYALAIAGCRSHIRNLPAADVRPVVHGKWENTGGHEWRCSQCGYGIMPWNAGQNFCPICGARMEEN